MNHPVPLFEEAVRHHRAGQLPQAEALYRQVLQHDPTNAGAWNNLGRIAAKVKNHVAAAQLFSRALALDPTNITTRLNLAASLKALGQRTEALALLQETWTREFGPGFLSAGDFGVRELVRRLCTDPLSLWTGRLNHLRAYAELVEEQGAFIELEPLLVEVRASVVVSAANPAELTMRLRTLLGALGFLKTSDKNWNAKVFQTLALPWMKDALALGYHDLAFKLEEMVYSNYVKQTETEEHFRDCFSQWIPAMREAGQRVGAGLGPVSWPEGNGAPVVGFFLHNANPLAHVEVLLNMLEGWAGLEIKPFIPRVYVFFVDNPRMLERFAELGVPVVLLEQSCAEAGQDQYRRLLCLRERCVEDRVTALVWVSAATMMPFAFALRLAPVQIWWAMKYHSLDFPEIDGYLAVGGIARYKEIGGRVWRAHVIPASNWYDPSLTSAAAEIRSRYGQHRILLGSFGREEKLDSPEFLAAVCGILQKHPEAGFLWTGRNRLERIQRQLEAAALAPRCHFIGWVNTRLYAQVVDVFLDSFPLPCGLTLLQAMAAGRPAVLYASEEAYDTGLHGLVTPVLEGKAGTDEEQSRLKAIFNAPGGEPLYFLARNAEEYVQHASQLLADPSLRSHAGEAHRRFIAEFLSDSTGPARMFAEHLLEIIEGRKRDAMRSAQNA